MPCPRSARLPTCASLQFADHDLGFDELNRLFSHLGDLIDKLRAVAVDKDVLRFEIGLLEKFVITSEVVRDWGDYIARLLAEINQVMPTPLLFSLFQVGDDSYDVEIFWIAAADEARAQSDRRPRARAGRGRWPLRRQGRDPGPPSRPDRRRTAWSWTPRASRLHTKSLMVDQPKIGGIVGIGVHSVDDRGRDPAAWSPTASCSPCSTSSAR